MKSQDISFIHTFGILLVVTGHCFVEGLDSLFPFWWIYSFHMPLFFFIAGYLFCYSTEPHMRKDNNEVYIIMRKAKRLLLPYIIISSLVFLPKALLAQYAKRPIDLSIEQYLHMLAYPRDNVIMYYWFLPTLFILFCFAIMNNYLFKNRIHINCYILWGILLLFHFFNPLKNVHFLCLNEVIQNMIYFYTGYLLCNNKWFQILQNNYKLLLLPLIILSIITTLLNIHEKILTTIFSALPGIALIIVIGKIYTEKKWHFLDHLFPHSYAIYLLSWFPQVFSYQYLGMILGFPKYIVFCLSLLMGIYIPTVIDYCWLRILRRQ